MAKTTDEARDAANDDRIIRVLSGMIVGIIVLSIVAIILYMIGTANAWPTTFTTVLWAIFFFGLPIAIIIVIVMMIRSAALRRRASARPRS